MEINFTKQNGVWVAEFEAPSNFNLHLERNKGGIIRVLQRGCSEGLYESSYFETHDEVVDCDFGALVYPKWIKVISGSEVIKGEVTFG